MFTSDDMINGAVANYLRHNSLIDRLETQFDGVASISFGSGDVTVSGSNLYYGSYALSAAGAPRNMAFPASASFGPRAFSNGSGQTITVKIGSSTGFAIPNGYRAILYADGTDVRLAGPLVPVTAPTYTQTYSTAARTVNAYTPDTESVAYTGIDNTDPGTVYATVADLNALRVAVENLRAMSENLLQVVTALIDDAQAAKVIG